MTIKYRGKEYRLPLKYQFAVEYYQMILRLKRIKRWIIRIFKDNKELHILPLIALILITISIITLVELGKYENYFLAFFDFKDSILITVLGTFIHNIYVIYSDWHRKMVLQYDIYYSFMCESEWFVESILEVEGLEIKELNFLDITLVRNKKIYKIKNQEEEVYKEEIINEKCNEYIKEIKNVRENFIKNKLINFDIEEFNNNMNDTIELIKEYKKHRISTKKFIDEIINNIFRLISITRRPWRWDYKIDKKIRKIIRENKIGDINPDVFDRLEYYGNEQYYDIE